MNKEYCALKLVDELNLYLLQHCTRLFHVDLFMLFLLLTNDEMTCNGWVKIAGMKTKLFEKGRLQIRHFHASMLIIVNIFNSHWVLFHTSHKYPISLIF